MDFLIGGVAYCARCIMLSHTVGNCHGLEIRMASEKPLQAVDQTIGLMDLIANKRVRSAYLNEEIIETALDAANKKYKEVLDSMRKGNQNHDPRK